MSIGHVVVGVPANSIGHDPPVPDTEVPVVYGRAAVFNLVEHGNTPVILTSIFKDTNHNLLMINGRAFKEVNLEW